MCAIVGVWSPEGQAAYHTRRLLHFQQNRGQDTAGIYTVSNGSIYRRKGEGKVGVVFGEASLPQGKVSGNVAEMKEFGGTHAVGHTRYVTSGMSGIQNAPPFITQNERYIVLFAYNGHNSNYAELSDSLDLERRMQADLMVGQVNCDAIPIMYTFADGLLKHADSIDGIIQGARDVMENVRGAYSAVATVYDKKSKKALQVAFKDPHGFRPGFFGKLNGGFAVTSESYALERTGHMDIKPIKNGEVIIIDGEVRRQQLMDHGHYPCQFEEGYFSRALSAINGKSINSGRYRQGVILARQLEHRKSDWLEDIDFVTYVPNTPQPIAKGLCHAIRADFVDCIEKDLFNYAREFINPANARHTATRERSAVHWDAVCEKNFILVEDSIVRGETLKEIIIMLKRAGAGNIYVVSAYPLIKYTCNKGIDLKTQQELIAHEKNEEEIAEAIGAQGFLALTQEQYTNCWEGTKTDLGIKRKVKLGIFSPEMLEEVGKRCNTCTTGKEIGQEV